MTFHWICYVNLSTKRTNPSGDRIQCHHLQFWVKRKTTWWFQPSLKLFVNLDHFYRDRVENKLVFETNTHKRLQVVSLIQNTSQHWHHWSLLNHKCRSVERWTLSFTRDPKHGGSNISNWTPSSYRDGNKSNLPSKSHPKSQIHIRALKQKKISICNITSRERVNVSSAQPTNTWKVGCQDLDPQNMDPLVVTLC